MLGAYLIRSRDFSSACLSCSSIRLRSVMSREMPVIPMMSPDALRYGVLLERKVR